MMGFAIDAAMPEGWLHVVAQHLEHKPSQQRWSKAVASAMSLLFLGNIVYSFLTTGDTSGGTSGGFPSDVQGWVLLSLMVLRVSVGFLYITVRECQEFISRYEAKAQHTQPPTPATPLVDVEALVRQVLSESVVSLQSQQQQALQLMRIEQQRMLSHVQEVQKSIASLDSEAVITRLTSHGEALFEAVRQQVTIHEAESEATQVPQIGAPKRQKEVKARKTEATSSPRHMSLQEEASEADTKTIRREAANATRNELKTEVYRLADEEGLSSYKIADRIGKPPQTVQRWLKERQSQGNEARSDAISEAPDEAEKEATL
jgi:hypothetical protein